MNTDINQYFRNGKIQNKEGIQTDILNHHNKQNKASNEKDFSKDVNNKDANNEIKEINEKPKTDIIIDLKEEERTNNYEIGIDNNPLHPKLPYFNSIQIKSLINQNEEGLNQDSPEVSPIKKDSDISNYVLKNQDDAGFKKPTRMDWYPKLNASKVKSVKLDEIKQDEKKDEEIKEEEIKEVPKNDVDNIKDIKPMIVGGGGKEKNKYRYQYKIEQEEQEEQEDEDEVEVEHEEIEEVNNDNQNENELEQISDINIENKTISEENLEESPKISQASVKLSK